MVIFKDVAVTPQQAIVSFVAIYMVSKLGAFMGKLNVPSA